MKYVLLFQIFLFSVFVWTTDLSGQDTIKLPQDSLVDPKINNATNIDKDTIQPNTIGKTLMDLIRKEQAGKSKDSDIAPDIMQYFNYTNMTISSIRIVRLNPFGPTIQEPEKNAVSFFDRTANNIHFRTHESIIKNNLLFHVGEEINPYTITDNERLLRSLPFIEDARIIVSQDKDTADNVEITVFTKDVFPYAFGIGASSAENGNLDIWNNNLLGFGHVVKNTIYWNTDEQTPLGYYMQYRVKNLASTFIDAEFEYIDRFGNKGYKAQVSRPFFSPETRYAGEISYEKMQRYRNYWTFDTTYAEAFTDYYRLDSWIARSIRLTPSQTLSKYRTSIVISGRWFRDFYYQTPDFVHENTFRTLQTRELYLSSISFIRQNFTKTSFIYSFGRTEDLPFGYNITFTSGIESSLYNRRSYFAGQTSVGKYHYPLGYFYGKAEAGSFINMGEFEQSVIRLEGLYFSHLYGQNKFHYRIFKRFNYTKGFGLFANEYLTIEDKQGISGLKSEQLRGTEKLTASLETVLFTPWKPLNFRIALFAFTDWAITNNKYEHLFNNHLYQNIGAGIRFRNENLVFNTIEFRLSYFFDTPNYMDAQYYQFLGEPRLRPATFYSKKPDIIDL